MPEYNIHQHILYVLAINCQWNSWTFTDSCSKSCNGGTRTKVRTKLIPETNGGICSGESYETEKCNTQDCPGAKLYAFLG